MTPPSYHYQSQTPQPPHQSLPITLQHAPSAPNLQTQMQTITSPHQISIPQRPTCPSPQIVLKTSSMTTTTLLHKHRPTISTCKPTRKPTHKPQITTNTTNAPEMQLAFLQHHLLHTTTPPTATSNSTHPFYPPKQTSYQHLPRHSPMPPSHLIPSPPPSTSGHFLLPESLMKNLPSLPSLTPLCFKPSSLSSDLHSISHSQLPSIPSLLPPHTTTSIQPKIPIPIHNSHATAASNPAPSTMVEQTSSATIPLEWTLHNHMATTFTSTSSHPYHQQLSMPSVGPAAVLPAPTSFFPRQTFMHTNPTAHYTSPQTHQHLTRPLCLIGPPYSPFAPTREKLNSQPSSKPLQKLPPLHSSH